MAASLTARHWRVRGERYGGHQNIGVLCAEGKPPQSTPRPGVSEEKQACWAPSNSRLAFCMASPCTQAATPPTWQSPEEGEAWPDAGALQAEEQDCRPRSCSVYFKGRLVMLKGLRHPQFTPSTFLSRAAGPRLSQVSFSQYCSVPGRWSTALLRPGEGVGDAQLRKPGQAVQETAVTVGGRQAAAALPSAAGRNPRRRGSPEACLKSTE